MVTADDAFFTFTKRVAGILAFEAALARALARAGVVPGEVADVIVRHCVASSFDEATVSAEAASAGNEAIPIVEQLRRRVAAESEAAATFVHWGATSQDALDTSLVLQLRDALAAFDRELTELATLLAALAVTHSATAMVGRTWLQAAAPTTFGFKVAGWLDAVQRDQSRVADVRARVPVLQFGGSVGNLAVLGSDGPPVAAALADELDLELPRISWHAARDRVAEVTTTLAIIVGTLAKIARDISLMAQSEVSEVAEASAPGRGRSSTMPQKRNPVGCASVLAASVRAPALASAMLSAMTQEHERGLGGWQAEWSVVPEMCGVAFGALRELAVVVRGLGVDPARMAENLEATNGLIFAERVSFALSARMGGVPAHAALGQAIEQCRARRTSLRETLKANRDIAAHFSGEEIDGLFDARTYLGTAEDTARAVAAITMRDTGSSRTVG